MLVRVKVYGWLTDFTGGEGDKQVQLPPGALVADLLSTLGIPAEVVGMVNVNGEHAETRDALGEGDTVYVLPHLAGGCGP